jgi:translation elongation factor EF-1alpha
MQPKKKLVGKVTHYFTKIGVGVIELSDELRVGDRISIEGSTTNIQQVVESMQIEKKPVQSAGPGQSIGLKVKDRVREGDLVYKIIE